MDRNEGPTYFAKTKEGTRGIRERIREIAHIETPQLRGSFIQYSTFKVESLLMFLSSELQEHLPRRLYKGKV